jgi:hypothetical protein
MATVNANYNFQVDSDGTNFKFTYQKGKYGVKAFFSLLLFYGLIGVPLVILFIDNFESIEAIVFTYLLIALGGSGINFFLLNAARNQSGIFIIKPHEFSVGGNQYQRQDINSIFVQLPNGEKIGETPTKGGYVFLGTGVQGAFMAGTATAINAVSNASQEAGQLFRAEKRKISFKILFRYGTRDIVLADGLTQQTAAVLLEKIFQVCANDSEAIDKTQLANTTVKAGMLDLQTSDTTPSSNQERLLIIGGILGFVIANICYFISSKMYSSTNEYMEDFNTTIERARAISNLGTFLLYLGSIIISLAVKNKIFKYLFLVFSIVFLLRHLYLLSQ